MSLLPVETAPAALVLQASAERYVTENRYPTGVDTGLDHALLTWGVTGMTPQLAAQDGFRPTLAGIAVSDVVDDPKGPPGTFRLTVTGAETIPEVVTRFPTPSPTPVLVKVNPKRLVEQVGRVLLAEDAKRDLKASAARKLADEQARQLLSLATAEDAVRMIAYAESLKVRVTWLATPLEDVLRSMAIAALRDAAYRWYHDER